MLHSPCADPWLDLALNWELSLPVLILQLPPRHGPFGTVSLSEADWSIVSAAAANMAHLLEVVKRRRWAGFAMDLRPSASR